MNWVTPVVHSPAAQRRAQLEVERLSADVVAKWENEVKAFGFIQGKVGVAFAMYELAAAGVPELDDHAERAMVAAVEQFNTGGANPGLHAGIAGLGWLIDAWLGEEELCGPIDESLLERLHQDRSAMPNIGLRAGLAGIGLYAARRAARVPTARVLLEHVSERLATSARHTPEGLTWATPVSYFESRGGKNAFGPEAELREYGSAHGVAPVVLLLSELHAQRVPTALPIAETLRWFWATTHAESNRFGWVTSGSQREPMNLFTWCTGDPGVALPCWLAAQSTGLADESAKWLAFGRSLAQRVVDGERPSLEKRVDLCCGLSGVMQLFSIWAALSGDPLLADAARAVMVRLLDELQGADLNELGVGFQFGTAGIAAALLAQTTGQPPSWAGPLAMISPVHAPVTTSR
jgi:lantibiotic modifying enzyme